MKTFGADAVGILSNFMIPFIGSAASLLMALTPLFLFIFGDCFFTLFCYMIFRGLNPRLQFLPTMLRDGVIVVARPS